MEKGGVNHTTALRLAYGLATVAILMVLSPIYKATPDLPVGEYAGWWLWLDQMSIAATVCLAILVLLLGKGKIALEGPLSTALILTGLGEAVYGLSQAFGLTHSLHPRYAMTGSFFNPGPYSGFLALVLPVCLSRMLCAREKIWAWIYGFGLLVMAIVLPACMSRSAWLAAAVSCLWAYAQHRGKWRQWWDCLRNLGRRTRAWMALACAGLVVLVGLLLFQVKPDSARGRLLIWRITCEAIANRPMSGCGLGGFPAAFGGAQEAWFSSKPRPAWQKRVAGSPEYAFCDYLQGMAELGIPCALAIMTGVAICMAFGVRRGRTGVVGALLSLLVFALSSYPLQLPTFKVVSVLLLLACLSDGRRWQWAVLALALALWGGLRLDDDRRKEQACREWAVCRTLYRTGSYAEACRDYRRLLPLLCDRPNFLFEYGHAMHRLDRHAEAILILNQASHYSNDPMILNVMAQDEQSLGHYEAAERLLLRSTHLQPTRLYPYYLLARLYALPSYSHPDRYRWARDIVLYSTPKVESTAVKQMREQLRQINEADITE